MFFFIESLNPPKTLLLQSSMQSPDLRQSGHSSNRRDTASNLSQRYSKENNILILSKKLQGDSF